jgi:predicted NAD/FAD-binding protein
MDNLNPKRTWNTPIRERWNAPIHHLLKAIDNHVDLYLKTGDHWHVEQADFLRTYLHQLKTWIHQEENFLK